MTHHKDSLRKLEVTLIPDEGVELRGDLLPYLSIVISHALPGVEAQVGDIKASYRPDAEVEIPDFGDEPVHKWGEIDSLRKRLTEHITITNAGDEPMDALVNGRGYVVQPHSTARIDPELGMHEPGCDGNCALRAGSEQCFA